SGYAKKYYPLSEEEARWSAQDCITLDKIPYIGRLSKSAPNHFVATGFGKWGMTSSMAAAQIISDIICKGESRYENIFSPARLNMCSARSFVKEAAHSVCGLAKGAVPFACSKLENLLPEHGGIVSLGGKKFGVYKDGSGVIYTVIPKCPHLGCQLEWNPDELSWDCPCHGSRFSYTGELIDNPAQKNLKKR
ncbi:MAG: FAD-dependent oxidoreductase, partial [Oscillospiraceae bacterium]